MLGIEVAGIHGRCVIRSADLAPPVVHGKTTDGKERHRAVWRPGKRGALPGNTVRHRARQTAPWLSGCQAADRRLPGIAAVG